jgi:regulator of protease activity HflC (stomatin/prohibitin superfamily)
MLIAGFAVVILAFMTLKIVPEYERLVVLRLGSVLDEPKGPGIVILIPIIDKATWVDLREMVTPIPHQVCITKDNASISVNLLIYRKVVDPIASYVQVQDFSAAAGGIAVTTLRAVIGDIPLDDVLAKREQINHTLQSKMDQITTRWGVKITTVEIQEITPPKDILDAMTRQMSAERTRRALVIEAEGTKAAAITVADGEKQSAILKAEGDRQAAILRAEGFALALSKIFEIAKGVDAKTMSLQYMETLKALGAGPATKFVLPMELTSLLSGIIGDSRKVFAPEKVS